MVIGNNNLTAKMKHFDQLLFRGYSQTDAYKLAYPAQATQRPGTLYPNASRLAANSKVKARLSELRAAVVAPAILDAIQRQEFWSHIICDDSKDTRDRLRASELLGKAQGDFIERTENKNLNVHAQVDRLEVLTDEQIDELLEIVEAKRLALEGAG
jgi:phage terminase small subunit